MKKNNQLKNRRKPMINKRLFKEQLFHLTFKVVRGLILTCCKVSLPLHHFEALCTRFQRILDNNGPKYTILYIKAVRGNFYNYLSGNPIRNPVSRSTSDGIPVVLGDLIPLIRGGNMRGIALILTILSATRSLKIETKPDLDTVTQPVKGDVPDLSKHMAKFGRTLGYRPTLSNRPRKLAVKTKTYRLSHGPNGRVLNTALVDIRYMPDSLRNALKSMSPKIGSILNIFSDNELVDFFDRGSKKTLNNNNCCRRLSTFADKEGKMRVIGVLDHGSQVTLKPLHIGLSRALSKIRQDCTLDQGKFKELLNNKGIEIYYSVDLSAATDRFPIQVIESLLKSQLPSAYVDAGKEVMVGQPFYYKQKYYKYSVGNPMGAYSSFNSFALTHHFIIYHCCMELGISGKGLPYALLGDDIVIGDSQVAEMYMKVIKSLHVEYSMAKTHKSKDFYEFAKRIFYKGEEITPFPISSIKENCKSPSAGANLLLEQQLRGWNFDAIASSSTLFFGSVLDLPSKFQKKIEKRVRTAEGVLSLVRGLQNGELFLNGLASTLQLPLPHINMEICKNIIANIAVEAFSESTIHTYFASSDHSSLPIWNELLRMKKAWDEYIEDNYGELSAFEILKYKSYFNDTPFYMAGMAILEEYEEMMKRIEKIDSTGSDGSYYMRNLALPVTTKSILEGENFKLMRSIDRFANLLEERLLILCQYPQLLEM